MVRERERKYSEEEFTSIIRSAAGATDASRALPVRRGGLTLSEIEEIAAEVGVTRAAVERAARNLPSEPESEFTRLLGGPARMQLAFAVPGEADAAMADRVVESIRWTTGQQGLATRSGATVEWRGGAMAVSVVAARNENRVTIVADRSEVAALTVTLATLSAGMAIGITGAILEPTGVVPIAGLVTGIAGTAALAARTLWARSTARFRLLVERVSAAVAEAVPQPHDPVD